ETGCFSRGGRTRLRRRGRCGADQVVCNCREGRLASRIVINSQRGAETQSKTDCEDAAPTPSVNSSVPRELQQREAGMSMLREPRPPAQMRQFDNEAALHHLAATALDE